jgi:hypothetical protein
MRSADQKTTQQRRSSDKAAWKLNLLIILSKSELKIRIGKIYETNNQQFQQFDDPYKIGVNLESINVG